MKLGEAMYKRSSQSEPAGAAPVRAPRQVRSGEKVVDAEFEEVDPDRRRRRADRLG